MNLSRRSKFIRIGAWIHRVGTCRVALMADVLAAPIPALRKFAQWRFRCRFNTLKDAAAGWQERMNAIMPELQALGSLTGDRKSQVLAARSVLLEEGKRIQLTASTLASYRGPAAAVLVPPLEYLLRKSLDRKRKAESFLKIASRLDSGTFYWDLLLWLMLPGSSSEDALGDLNEEYLLRASTDGEVSARAWYRDQVTGTLKNCVWEKIVRLAALGTLIDLVSRWFRR
jgi:hypothetical protein